MESFKAKLDLEKNSLGWDFTIAVPIEIAEKFIGTDRRVICSINNIISWHCALMPDGNGGFFIMINKENRKKLNAENQTELFIELKKDETKYGMAVPDFFEELCFQDPEADKLFHKLTPGKQRTLLHTIGKPKSEEKQLEKALIIFDYLKKSNGSIDFKELNEEFKTSRFKK
ncbi:MAG: YdeI/OmpD-associated family protein [Crocinitomicaceae bacterium]|nr:YdeI/OmpD-associated family protein [Crocinitomicaceae bacterium]